MTTKSQIIIDINCEEAAKRFNDFIDNYLRGKSKAELEHHVANCRHCFERMEFEKLLKEKVASITSSSSVEKISVEKSAAKILSNIFAQ